jgi:hypothetical protein
VAELYEGIYCSTNPASNEKALNDFLSGTSTLGIEDEVGHPSTTDWRYWPITGGITRWWIDWKFYLSFRQNCISDPHFDFLDNGQPSALTRQAFSGSNLKGRYRFGMMSWK